jgi:hypothetical protein
MNDDRTSKWPANLQRAASTPGRYLVFLGDGTQLFVSHAEPADKFGAWIRLYFRSKYPPSMGANPYVGIRRNGEGIRIRTKFTEIRVASIREVRETPAPENAR